MHKHGLLIAGLCAMYRSKSDFLTTYLGLTLRRKTHKLREAALCGKMTINPVHCKDERRRMTENILKFWPVLLAFVGFLVWLIRLEARSVENTKEIKRLWNQRKEDMDLAKAAREDTNAMLAEIRDDIKALIAKVGSK
jgi:hypothetical protein